MIPEAAVEAAARALTVEVYGMDMFDGMSDDAQRILRLRGALLLEAAAPHMASAWHDAVSEAYVEGALGAEQANVMYDKNPYRTTT